MKIPALTDVHIRSVEKLYTPHDLRELMPVPAEMAERIAASRKEIAEVIQGAGKRFLAIVGPCSIHDPREGLIYAQRLVELSREVADVMLVVMRVYFENRGRRWGGRGW